MSDRNRKTPSVYLSLKAYLEIVLPRLLFRLTAYSRSERLYADLALILLLPWWNNFIGQYIKDNYEVTPVAATFIKSLQIVTPTILNGNQYVDYTIASIDDTKSVLFLLGCNPVNNDSRNFMHYFSIQNSTTLRLYRVAAPALGDLIAHAFILEFDPAFIASLQIKSFSLPQGDAQILVPIDAVDLSKTVIFPSGQRSYLNVTADIYLLRADLQNNTTLRLRRNTTGGSLDGQIRVVEFI